MPIREVKQQAQWARAWAANEAQIAGKRMAEQSYPGRGSEPRYFAQPPSLRTCAKWPEPLSYERRRGARSPAGLQRRTRRGDQQGGGGAKARDGRRNCSDQTTEARCYILSTRSAQRETTSAEATARRIIAADPANVAACVRWSPCCLMIRLQADR